MESSTMLGWAFPDKERFSPQIEKGTLRPALKKTKKKLKESGTPVSQSGIRLTPQTPKKRDPLYTSFDSDEKLNIRKRKAYACETDVEYVNESTSTTKELKLNKQTKFDNDERLNMYNTVTFLCWWNYSASMDRLCLQNQCAGVTTKAWT